MFLLVTSFMPWTILTMLFGILLVGYANSVKPYRLDVKKYIIQAGSEDVWRDTYISDGGIVEFNSHKKELYVKFGTNMGAYRAVRLKKLSREGERYRNGKFYQAYFYQTKDSLKNRVLVLKRGSHVIMEFPNNETHLINC